MSLSKPLTPKQDEFARAYVETGCASEAYRHAYDAKNMTDKTINESASRVAKDRKVTARIEQLRAEHRERHDMTVDRLTAMLLEDRAAAHRNGQLGAAVSASMGLAKLHGRIVDKTKNEHTGADGALLIPTVNVNISRPPSAAFVPNAAESAKH